MEELVQALKILGIERFLVEKEKEALSLFTRGLFEGGKSVNNSILVVKKYLGKI